MEGFTGFDTERYFVTIYTKSALYPLSLFALFPSQLFASENNISVESFSSANAAPQFGQSKLSRKESIIPTVLSRKEKEKFATIFSAIENKKWIDAKNAIDDAPKGPLRYMAQAELFLAAGSPRIERDEILTLINNAPYLPQAEQLGRLATRRGADILPSLPGRQKLSFKGSSPRRGLPKSIEETGADKIRNRIISYIKNDAPESAEDVLNHNENHISDSLRTELQYRIAWSYYIENDDQNALRLATQAGNASGEWAVQAKWVTGLVNWRLQAYDASLAAFDHVARFAHNEDLRSAGYYWSSRAAVAAHKPSLSQSRLLGGAQYQETFYGLLAREALGMVTKSSHNMRLDKKAWKKLRSEDNVQIALGLSELGKDSLAKEALQFQARISEAGQHNNLAKLASEIGLPETQLWLAHYGPSNRNADISSRYPVPKWKPTKGWRIDSSLAFAHTLQESAWRKNVVSPANAHGLMQVRPGTARDIARSNGYSFKTSDLHRPSINLEYGQSFLEYLRDSSETEGLMPKIIAAYNAGLTPITRWNHEVKDGGDPLLYIESIPYWETRGYVATIFRNYWIYEQKNSSNSGSKAGLAQNLWPSFPDAANGNRVNLKRKNSNGKYIANR